MRHLGEIDDDRLAADGLAEGDGEFVLGLVKSGEATIRADRPSRVRDLGCDLSRYEIHHSNNALYSAAYELASDDRVNWSEFINPFVPPTNTIRLHSDSSYGDRQNISTQLPSIPVHTNATVFHQSMVSPKEGNEGFRSIPSLPSEGNSNLSFDLFSGSDVDGEVVFHRPNPYTYEYFSPLDPVLRWANRVPKNLEFDLLEPRYRRRIQHEPT